MSKTCARERKILEQPKPKKKTFGEETTMKCCRNLHATMSSKLEETSEDPKKTKNFLPLFYLILYHFYSLFYFACISHISINHYKSISIKSLHHLHNNVPLISQSSHKKRSLKEEDSSKLVHSMFQYFEIILNRCYTNKN